MIFLDRPLTSTTFRHRWSRNSRRQYLTRNVSISSESSVVDRRGHVMFMHNRDVHIANAGFYQLGRTDKSRPINDRWSTPIGN